MNQFKFRLIPYLYKLKQECEYSYFPVEGRFSYNIVEKNPRNSSLVLMYKEI